jgi:hypothetical protein
MRGTRGGVGGGAEREKERPTPSRVRGIRIEIFPKSVVTSNEAFLAKLIIQYYACALFRVTQHPAAEVSR